MRVESISPDRLSPNPLNARVHSQRQVKQIANSISAFGFVVPVLVDEYDKIIAGHGRLAAAKLLELPEIPVIRIEGLSAAKKRALAIADNQIPTNARWNRVQLVAELDALTSLLSAEQIEIEITGFEPAEIEALQVELETERDPTDDVSADLLTQRPVTTPGDRWSLGHHKLICCDGRSSPDLQELMQGESAAAAFLDPPYNTPARMIGSRGRTKHSNFAMAYGELSTEQFTVFLAESMQAAAALSKDGAIHFVCMDWRGVLPLLAAGQVAYGSLLNLVVWDKMTPGQGSFYRSQHELIGVFRVGQSPHMNNIQLGRYGRNRSNLWRHPGANGFRAGRDQDLQDHPTIKPVQLVIEALKDCTRRGDLVLDTFAGSGTTILAAERCDRRARATEIEPRFVDLAIRRWQEFSGKDAVHETTGLTFSETADKKDTGHG